MADKYCSAQFKTGEELDAALKAALDTCDYSVAASECRQAAEKHRAEAEVSEHNAEVYAEGGKLEAHEGQTVSPEEIPGAKGYMEQAQSHKSVASIQAENAKAYAEGGTPFEDVGDGMFVGGMPTLGAKGYVDQAKVYVEGGEAPMTPPELGDGVVRSHGAKNLADRAAAYSVGGDYQEYYRGGTWETIHVEKGAMQYAEEARLAAEQAAKGVQDAANSATAAAHSEELAEKYWIAADKARSEAVGANSWAQIYKDEAAESATAAAKSAEEAKNAAASGGGGSSGGGVSSWNDLTDKPFGEEEGFVLTETTVTFDEESVAFLPKPTAMVANQSYTVNWNGTDYFCYCVYHEAEGMSGLVIGNLDMFGIVSGFDDIPFVIVDGGEEMLTATGAYGMIISLAGDESATFSIRGTVANPIDTKYLPKHLQFGDEIKRVFSFEGLPFVNGQCGITDPLSLTPGNSYKVSWNGVEYNCVALHVGEHVFIGNQADVGGTDTGEPFIIVVREDGGVISGESHAMFMALDGSSEVTVIIDGEVTTPIKDKYLPEYVGDAVVLNFTGSGDDAFSSCDVLFEEAENLVRKGKALFARNYSPSNYFESDLYTMSEYRAGRIVFMRIDENWTMRKLVFNDDNTFMRSQN